MEGRVEAGDPRRPTGTPSSPPRSRPDRCGSCSGASGMRRFQRRRSREPVESGIRLRPGSGPPCTTRCPTAATEESIAGLAAASRERPPIAASWSTRRRADGSNVSALFSPAADLDVAAGRPRPMPSIWPEAMSCGSSPSARAKAANFERRRAGVQRAGSPNPRTRHSAALARGRLIAEGAASRRQCSSELAPSAHDASRARSLSSPARRGPTLRPRAPSPAASARATKPSSSASRVAASNVRQIEQHPVAARGRRPTPIERTRSNTRSTPAGRLDSDARHAVLTFARRGRANGKAEPLAPWASARTPVATGHGAMNYFQRFTFLFSAPNFDADDLEGNRVAQIIAAIDRMGFQVVRRAGSTTPRSPCRPTPRSAAWWSTGARRGSRARRPRSST